MTGGRASCVAVVRRGETEVFRTLQDRFAELALADVIWDRRLEERRTTAPDALATERRRRDRRAPPPPTWAPLGFLLSTPVEPESQSLPGGTRRRPAGGHRTPRRQRAWFALGAGAAVAAALWTAPWGSGQRDAISPEAYREPAVAPPSWPPPSPIADATSLPAEEETPVEIIAIGFKVVSQTPSAWTWSWKLTLQNHSDASSVGARIEFIGSDGALVDDQVVCGIQVPAGAIGVARGTHGINASVSRRISTVTAKASANSASCRPLRGERAGVTAGISLVRD